MIRLAVQYLEPGPQTDALAPESVSARLREVFATLPLDALLLGWNLPRRLIDAAAEVTARAGVGLYLWHPLLTGDGRLRPSPAWQAVGLDGARVPGHLGMDEFTFVCPNRPEVRGAIVSHLAECIPPGLYTGVFLDKIRWPSPAADPTTALACFCPACRQACTAFDLEQARSQIASLTHDPDSALRYIEMLLDPRPERVADAATRALHQLMDFRAQTVVATVGAVSSQLRSLGLSVGLDCFTPGLAPFVGQDLTALDARGDWIKTMSYAHTLGPAGIPFELLGILDWLVDRRGVPEPVALASVGAALGWSLPSSRAALRRYGVPSSVLAAEVTSARRAGPGVHLIGVELNDIPGVAELSDDQLRADLTTVRAAAPDGLVLSWDLHYIPQSRLDLVRSAYLTLA